MSLNDKQKISFIIFSNFMVNSAEAMNLDFQTSKFGFPIKKVKGFITAQYNLIQK